jgi:hypothetical protein
MTLPQMILLKLIGWCWLAQLVLAGVLLGRYGLGQAKRVISERLSARKTVTIEELV